MVLQKNDSEVLKTMRHIQLTIIALILSISVSSLLFAQETTEKPEESVILENTKNADAAESLTGEAVEEKATDAEEIVETEAGIKKEDAAELENEEEAEADTDEEAEAEDGEEEYDEDTYGPEAPIIWMRPVKGVAFVHKVHTMDAGLDCDTCHDDFFEMEAGAAEERDDFIMKTIYEGGYCGACHDGDSAFAANTQCATCHIGVMGVKRENGEEEVGH